MAEKYPNQWLGIKNPEYFRNDGVSLESGAVVYVGETKKQLLKRQIINGERIVHWLTSDGDASGGLYTISLKR